MTRPHIVKLRAGQIRQYVRGSLHLAQKHPSIRAAECFEKIIQSVDSGRFERHSTKPGPVVDATALRRYLTKGLAYVQRYPQATAVDSMQRLLAALDAGQFAPMHRDQQREAVEARKRARNAQQAPEDQGTPQEPENGVHGRTEHDTGVIHLPKIGVQHFSIRPVSTEVLAAARVSVDGRWQRIIIDTDPLEEW